MQRSSIFVEKLRNDTVDLKVGVENNTTNVGAVVHILGGKPPVETLGISIHAITVHVVSIDVLGDGDRDIGVASAEVSGQGVSDIHF